MDSPVRISQLIAFLEKAKQDLGDVPVWCERDAGFGVPFADKMHTTWDGEVEESQLVI